MPPDTAPTATADRDSQPRIDPLTRRALRSFKEILAAKYGPHLRSLYLFGSRARGDHRPDSDIDIAVFLDEAPDPLGEQFDLIERGYDIVLDTGVNIQPWVFAQASLSDPAHHRAALLVSTIRREGIPLWS
jgi:predicted nucleotidyltransferase